LRGASENDRAGHGNAVRRLGDPSGIGHGRDGSKRLRGLGVCHNGTVGSVNTGRILAFTFAGLEDAVDVSSGGVVLAANTIKDVLAKLSSPRAGGVAELHAENVGTHEVVPLKHLLEVVASGSRILGEVVRVHEATKRVAALVSTMRVELASSIISLDVDEVLVDVAGHLNVVGGLDEGDASDGTSRDNTSTAAGLSAPGNRFTFGVTDEGVGLRRAPEAKVANCVNGSRLAHRVGTLGGRVTPVVTLLSTTITTVSVGLVGEVVP